MSDTDHGRTPGPPTSSRRQFLLGGAVAGIGAAAAIGAGYAISTSGDPEPEPVADVPRELNGTATIPFYGTHQAGIASAPAAHGLFVGLDLAEDVDRTRLRQMMRLLSDDASRLTQGVPALADTEAELAATPARLTVTFGFGPGFVRRADGDAPTWLRPLPAFSIDKLRDEFSHGDLLIQVSGDEPMSVAHAARMLLKDTRAFATVRWTQTGFRRAFGSATDGTAMRNLFGQVDETVNPQPDTANFDQLVWVADGWLTGGTGLVLRRIQMNLDTWDELDRPGRELSVGRNLTNGAPLTGNEEKDEPDFDATDALGFPVIPEFSHMRRARADDTGQRFFRRSFNYDDPPEAGQVSNSGLIFASYQADINRQFIPIQRRLDELDLLNQWTTPIGSAVFAVPPGCQPGGYVGETILQ